MLMRGDSCLRGHEFESHERILDGSFISCKIVLIFEKIEKRKCCLVLPTLER